MAKELWTVAQAAEALSVSEDTVRRLINGGQLPAYQITERTTRLDPLDVYAYLDSRKKKTAALQRKTRVGVLIRLQQLGLGGADSVLPPGAEAQQIVRRAAEEGAELSYHLRAQIYGAGLPFPDGLSRRV